MIKDAIAQEIDQAQEKTDTDLQVRQKAREWKMIGQVDVGPEAQLLTNTEGMILVIVTVRVEKILFVMRRKTQVTDAIAIIAKTLLAATDTVATEKEVTNSEQIRLMLTAMTTKIQK